MTNKTVTDKLVIDVANSLTARQLSLAAAESCTGGLVAAACTDIPGASAWFDRGWVTYSNAAKQDCLGVPPALIAQHGAVSKAVAAAMATGALQHSHANISLAITGIAGPDGGSADKPIGTVWLAWAMRGREALVQCQQFDGDRNAVRQQAVNAALAGVLTALKQNAN